MPRDTGAESSAARQRLFFALWPDDEVRRRLAAIAAKRLKRRGRRVPPEKLHLTLAFLGAVGPDARTCLEAAAERAARAPFTLVFDRLGYWPRPRVIWSSCAQTPEALQSLVASLRAGMTACGLEPEVRPYRAHLTLARKASVAPGFAEEHPPVTWTVREFHLVESQTLPAGAQYRILRTWRA